MLQFKKITINDIDIFKKFLNDKNEFSCETAFVNLLIWQEAYENMYAATEDYLVIKSRLDGKEVFRLPFGKNFDEGFQLVCEYAKTDYPVFWAQEGLRLNEFIADYGSKYTMTENRDLFDYIYLRENLVNLKGKKYHSKRNHISAFTKKYNWIYEDITDENTDDVRKCCEQWYSENTDRMDKFLLCEQHGAECLLKNRDLLSVKGGLIRVEGKVVAFTLGSPINADVFDIHIEKALRDYSEAYTVINREFARNALDGYQYINREDDMGLEGLRKAKLSYKPEILLKKYYIKSEESYDRKRTVF